MPDLATELRGAAQRFFRRFGVLSSQTTPCGQPLATTHAHALMILLKVEACSQQELGADLGIDKSNVARLCARMVEAGHADQHPSPDDARSRIVSLSAKGRTLAALVDHASRARFGALLAAIPVHRRQDVVDALVILANALESAGEPVDDGEAR